jgi:hypothetical protein
VSCVLIILDMSIIVLIMIIIIIIITNVSTHEGRDSTVVFFFVGVKAILKFRTKVHVTYTHEEKDN